MTSELGLKVSEKNGSKMNEVSTYTVDLYIFLNLVFMFMTEPERSAAQLEFHRD